MMKMFGGIINRRGCGGGLVNSLIAISRAALLPLVNFYFSYLRAPRVAHKTVNVLMKNHLDKTKKLAH